MRPKFQIVADVVILVILAAISFGVYHRFSSPPMRALKAIAGNLRQIATASSQYMLDKHATRASYYDIVGFSSDKYVRTVAPVAGEDYTGLVQYQTQTQISISTRDGTTVTFNI